MKASKCSTTALFLLIAVIFSSTFCLAVTGPRMRVDLAESPKGNLTALFKIDIPESSLCPGWGELMLENGRSLRARIVRSEGGFETVYTRERWDVEEDRELALKMLCLDYDGRFRISISDEFDNTERLIFSTEGLYIDSSPSGKRLLDKFCSGRGNGEGESGSSYRKIHGVSEIEDIDNFLNTCPSTGELGLLKKDFALVYEPAYISSGPSYACRYRGTRKLEPNARLVYYQALRVIRHMQLTKPLPWTNLHPYEWLKSRIGGIMVRENAANPTCCSSLIPAGEEDPVTAIKMPRAEDFLVEARMNWHDSSTGVGLWGLIGVIFHEARHVDLPHNCGPEGNKDSSLEYMGAWAVQYHVLKMMAEGAIDVGLDKQYYQSVLENKCGEIKKKRFCEEY